MKNIIITIITITAVIIIISNVRSNRIEAWEAMTPEQKIAAINYQRANDCPNLDEAYLVSCNQMYNERIDSLNLN